MAIGDKGVLIAAADGLPVFLPLGDAGFATCNCGGPMTITISGLASGEKWPRTGQKNGRAPYRGGQFGNGVHKVCASRFRYNAGDYTLWKTNQFWFPGYTGTTSKTVRGGGIIWQKWQGYNGGWALNGIGGALAVNTSYQYANRFTRYFYLQYTPTYTAYWKTISTTRTRTIAAAGHNMKWIYPDSTAPYTATTTQTAGGGAFSRAVQGIVTLNSVNGSTPLNNLSTLPRAGTFPFSPADLGALFQTHVITSNYGGTPHNVTVTWQVAPADLPEWQSWGKNRAGKFSWYTFWSTNQTGYNPWYYPYKSNRIQYGRRFYYSCFDVLA